MALNSIREQLICNVVDALNGLTNIQTVARKKLGFDDLQAVAGSQLPYIGVVAGLPELKEIKWSPRAQGRIDNFISKLVLQLTVYGLERENPDQEISNMADEVWRKLYENYTRGDLALSTLVLPELETGIFDPYFAFNMRVEITYIHTTLSI